MSIIPRAKRAVKEPLQVKPPRPRPRFNQPVEYENGSGLRRGVLIIDTATGGLAFKSSDGHYWRATVDDAGAITTADEGTAAADVI